jgi:hypothetical protein
MVIVCTRLSAATGERDRSSLTVQLRTDAAAPHESAVKRTLGYGTTRTMSHILRRETGKDAL